MDLEPNQLYIGTSGWSYAWRGIFYPEDLKSADMLPFYAEHFNCTEVNSSFYHFTMEKTIQKWLDTTPAHFKFAPKLHRSITHENRLQNVEEPLRKWMDRFLVMGDRLGPVLVQLPGSFHYNELIAKHFFTLLRELYPNTVFALEVRHASWHTEEVLELLEEFEVSLVVISAGKRWPALATSTTNTVYMRLHGHEQLYRGAYPAEEMERFAYMAQDWLMDGKTVWAFFNNTIGGNATADADRLKQAILNL
ncbi:DUF72 domain-containing protein [Nibribacter ruber]|uniref:DUF72 domain-containing protein n=1 Tax=Nibribacter ruber TaxID=2698458 RepID=A0A6P1NY18_9BACT|nr:DUF72 domain-containing protein [Nibribacter ruber]QHL87254.1 DUF72 domain-containing protein [Nibribacter ruber]